MRFTAIRVRFDDINVFLWRNFDNLIPGNLNDSNASRKADVLDLLELCIEISATANSSFKPKRSIKLCVGNFESKRQD